MIIPCHSPCVKLLVENYAKNLAMLLTIIAICRKEIKGKRSRWSLRIYSIDCVMIESEHKVQDLE